MKVSATRREVLAGGAALMATAGTKACAPQEHRALGESTPSVCRICTVACGINVWVEGDRVVRVHGRQDSPTRGFICANGLALPEIQASPRRVTQPLVRRDGVLRPASWDEALNVAAAGIGNVIDRQGPRAVAFQTGWALVYRNMIGWIKRLADAIGTPNFASSSSICVAASLMSSRITFGRIGSADFNRSDLMVTWGWNPMNSSPPLANVLLHRQRQGAKLVVIDPCRTRLATQADRHLQLRPGSDLALALGLLGIIIREGLYDEEFIRDQTIGFPELAHSVEPISVSWAADRTGIPATMIEDLARDLARASSTTCHTGVAVEQSITGFQTCRAIHCLLALTGNLGRHGGWRLLPRLGNETSDAARGLAPETNAVTEPAIGAAHHLLFTTLMGEAQGNLFPLAILNDDPYPLRAMMIVGANPVLSGPDSKILRRAFERLDMLVVVDPMMTETAEMAHVVLPAATFLESDDFVAMRGVGEVEAVVSPRGEARPDWYILVELAKKLGLERFFPWDTRNQARQAQAAALRRMTLPQGRYPTPSGKIELASEQLREAGIPAVPSLVNALDHPENYPLLLTTGARQPGFCNSQVRGVPLVEKRVGPPIVEISREVAEELHLENGGRAQLSTPYGELSVTLRLSSDLTARTVRLPHCMAEANANELTSIEVRDPATGFADLRALPCHLSPA